MKLVRKKGLDMPSKVEVGPGDIRPRTLAWLGAGLALIAALGMFVLDGAWLVVGACLVTLGVVFAVVGIWAERSGEESSGVQASAAPDAAFCGRQAQPAATTLEVGAAGGSRRPLPARIARWLSPGQDSRR
jgi:hypothetical protein